MIEIGRIIKNAREKANLTQAELGGMVECTWHHISKIERGEKYPSLRTLEKIFNVLSVEIPDDIKLLLDKDNQFKTELLQDFLSHLKYFTERDASVLSNLFSNMSDKNKLLPPQS